jgi:hypothetical protein
VKGEKRFLDRINRIDKIIYGRKKTKIRRTTNGIYGRSREKARAKARCCEEKEDDTEVVPPEEEHGPKHRATGWPDRRGRGDGGGPRQE